MVRKVLPPISFRIDSPFSSTTVEWVPIQVACRPPLAKAQLALTRNPSPSGTASDLPGPQAKTPFGSLPQILLATSSFRKEAVMEQPLA